MIGLFKDIVIDCHRCKLMTPLLNYFKDEEAEYLHYLQVLDSAVVNLSRSIPPVWESFHGSIRPNLMLPEYIPVTEHEVTNLPQREQSNCMYDGHISSSEVIPVSPSCPEYVLTPTNLHHRITMTNKQLICINVPFNCVLIIYQLILLDIIVLI